MAYDIGPKIGIEGEAEFRKAIRDINTTMRTLGTEMQVVTSEYDKNDNSAKKLAKQKEVLSKQIETQKQKLTELQKGLAAATEKYGENDSVTQRWQQTVNKATADLNNMERELKNAGKAADDNSQRFEKLGSVLKGAGVAMAAVAAAAGAAAIKMGKDVVKAFGELEQNLGGSEAVFGEYAARIQKTGEDAYKNLGVSQSDYLATANKMGALFQGSGIEQQKSLELTEKAMQRAADMASVMGIDMSAAMEAVTGAAKGNFTMMDNLGVAMNATSIEAYAVGKGLDFVWSKASQAEKAEMAMQMFFENTEQYAGNFAKESTETITGSIGMMKAALGSFTAGLGNTNSDMKKLTKNLVDAFKTVVKNIVPVLENIVTALPPAFGEILTAVGNLLPMLLETVTSLFAQVLETLLNLLPELIPAAVDAVMTIVGALIDNLPLLVDAAVQLVTTLVQGIGDALPKLIPAAVTAITTIVQGLIENLPMLLDAALQLIIGLAQGLVDAIPQLVAALPAIIKALVDFLVGAYPQIAEAGIQLLTSLVAELPTIITAIVEAIPEIIDSVIRYFTDCIPLIIEAGIELFIALVRALPEIIVAIVAAIPEIIDSVITALIDNIPLLIEAGVELFVALIENLPIIIIEIVKAVPEIINGIVEAFGSLAYKIVEVGGDLIKGLWQGIKDAGAWLWDQISGFFGGIVDGIKDFFGISSPSKLFAEMGGYMADGLGVGFKNEMDKVGKQMNAAVPIVEMEGNINTQPALIQAAETIRGNIMINLTAMLDGRQLARGLYEYNIEQGRLAGASLVEG